VQRPAFGRTVSQFLPLHVMWFGLLCRLFPLHTDLCIFASHRGFYPVRIDDSTPPETLPCSVHTFVRPLDRFPPNFESRAKASSKGFISPVRNEQSLLNCLLGTSFVFLVLILRGRRLTTTSLPPHRVTCQFISLVSLLALTPIP
jgi:hypothetical protein